MHARHARAHMRAMDTSRRGGAGCLATVGALCYGFVGFIQKDSKMMQNGMRGRVVAQFLTVATMLAASTSIFMKGRGGADAQPEGSK